jgi:exoribonuclease-2
MPSSHPPQFDLVAAALAAMLEHGFQPDFPKGVDPELAAIRTDSKLPSGPGAEFQDLRDLLWSSIDNDTSKDLDQIEWAERLPDGRIRVLIGVADVDVRVAEERSSTACPLRDDRCTPASKVSDAAAGNVEDYFAQ